MTLATEMQRLANIKDFAEIGRMSVKSVSSVVSGMDRVGIISGSTSNCVGIAVGALQTMTGMASLITAAKAIQQRRQAKDAAESAALIAANAALGPYGWWKIALAGSAAVMAYVGVSALVRNIKLGDFDLDSASGRSSAMTALQAAV